MYNRTEIDWFYFQLFNVLLTVIEYILTVSETIISKYIKKWLKENPDENLNKVGVEREMKLYYHPQWNAFYQSSSTLEYKPV